MIFSHSKWGLELGVAGIILDRGDTAERTKRCGTVTVCTTMIAEFRVIIATALCNLLDVWADFALTRQQVHQVIGSASSMTKNASTMLP